MENQLSLGGGIQLSGFSNIEPGKIIVIKKMVGNFIKKIGDENTKLNVSLKEVHKTEKSQKYEIHGVLDTGGNIKQAEIVDYNLFFALNKVLSKLK
jgi:hypothetical protein